MYLCIVLNTLRLQRRKKLIGFRKFNSHNYQSRQLQYILFYDKKISILKDSEITDNELFNVMGNYLKSDN